MRSDGLALRAEVDDAKEVLGGPRMMSPVTANAGGRLAKQFDDDEQTAVVVHTPNAS
jgi:hypothetical protein